MSLRDPSALLWLLLAVPLVALYLVRPRARDTRVGSLLLYRLVSAREVARAPLARLEKVLSLLLHLAALAGVVLALARPTFGPTSPRRIVLVLDASSSMASRFEGSTRFGRALDRARSLAAELRGEDELGFIVAGATPHLLLAPATRAAHPELALDAARIEGGTMNLADALDLARALTPTETWVLSDAAAPTPALSLPHEVGEGRGGGRLYFHRLGASTDANAGVVALAARAVPGSESELEVQATVLNASARVLSVRPTFTLDGLPLVALEPVALGPWSRANLAPRRLDLPSGGVVGLHLDAEGDVLDRDDDAFVVVPPQRRTRVSAPDAVFLGAALAADDSISVVQRDADIVIGESFVVGPRDVAAVASRLELRDLGAVTPPRVTKVVRDHPVLRHVTLDDAVFTVARRVDAPPSWEVLVGAGEVPLVLARETGRARELVFTFSPEDSDVVLRRAWPLLVSNAVSWLRGESLRESEPCVKAGAVAVVPCSKPVTSITSNGAAVPFVQGGDLVTTTATERPGVYEVLSGEERVGRFAVSLLDADESSVAARDTLGLGEKPAPSARLAVETVEPATLLPLLVLLLLVVESWAHHRRELG